MVRGGTAAPDVAKAAPAGQDVTGFVDPRIGNVAPLLVPTFPTFSLPNGKTFAIVAKGASPQRKYIQQASLNGKPLEAPFITHADVVSGGTLELVLSDLPNREWGRKAVVPQ